MLKVDWLKVLGLAKKNWKEIAIIVLLLTVIGKMRYDYRTLTKRANSLFKIRSKAYRAFMPKNYSVKNKLYKTIVRH